MHAADLVSAHAAVDNTPEVAKYLVTLKDVDLKDETETSARTDGYAVTAAAMGKELQSSLTACGATTDSLTRVADLAVLGGQRTFEMRVKTKFGLSPDAFSAAVQIIESAALKNPPLSDRRASGNAEHPSGAASANPGAAKADPLAGFDPRILAQGFDPNILAAAAGVADQGVEENVSKISTKF